MDVRIDAVVHRALEREPAQRYQHVSEVSRELASITAGAVPNAGPVVGPPFEPAREYVQLQVQGPAAALFVSAL